jgi:hypothetical protein
MPKKQLSWDDLFATIPLSEPLTTYKDSIQAIINLVGTSLGAIQQKEESTQKLLEEMKKLAEELAIDTIPSFMEMRDGRTRSLQELRKLKKRFALQMNEENLKDLETLTEENRNLRKRIQNNIRTMKRRYKEYSSLCTELSQELQAHKLERQLLIPMSFVYLVTVWDAFILDTARKILHVHPNLISGSTNTIEVSKSTLWGLGANELRDYLIDIEVRNLDIDRKKLVNCFKEHWGIDWEKSSVPLNKVIEIRARRDIWVHYKGVVNQQYLSMVGDDATLKFGQLAEITDEYLFDSLAELTILAIYIHKGAHKKHYSKIE